MEYKMPVVTVGQTVLWRHSPGSGPGEPAVVTGVYDFNIDCSVLCKDATRVFPRTGVRHCTDPEFPRLNPEAQGDGVWELSERDKMIDGVLRQLYGTAKGE